MPLHHAFHGNLQSSAFNSKSMIFDGVDEYITIPDDNTLDITSELSISAWIKLTDATGQNAVITKLDAGTGQRSWHFQIRSTGVVDFSVKRLIDGTGLTERSTPTVNDGAWHHIVGTYNASNVMKIYIDGSEVATTVSGVDEGDGSIAVSTSAVTIGIFSNLSTNPYVGNIDEVSLWSTAVLSAADVTQIYNAGSPTDLIAESVSATLVSWWRMGDDPSDSATGTIFDQVGSNDGVATNMQVGSIELDVP